MTDFIKESIAYGLKLGEFENLDKEVKRKLLKLMSRISERSYRRGFQHGKEIKGKTVDPFIFRYKTSLKDSPYTDTFFEDGKWANKSGHSSLDRLRLENGEFHNLGLTF